MKTMFTYIFMILIFSIGKSQTVAEHFQTKDFEAAIFPKEYKIYNSEKRFTPTKDEVLLAEKYLKFNLKQLISHKPHEKIYKNLSKDKRQYFGIIDENGNKILLINSFCIYRDSWLEQKVQVKDGGNCFWEIKFDISKNKFFELYINGES